MKTSIQKWVIVPLLCWASYAHTQTTSDTLVANISDRAQIYFIGKSKEDFKEIEKYDLNIVFKTLQQQAQNKKTKISTTEAEALRNDAFLTKMPKNSFWKKNHFHFYVGAIGGFSSKQLVYNEKRTFNTTTGLKTNVEILDYATFSFLPQLNVGLGFFREKKIIQNPDRAFMLRYGMGYQQLKIKPSYRSSAYSVLTDVNNTSSAKALIDTIRKSYIGASGFSGFNTMHYLNVEFIPTYKKLTPEGKTRWEVGFGLRGAIGGQTGFFKRAFNKLQGPNRHTVPLSVLSTPKNDFDLYFIPFDYALVANVGYKYLKFFAEYHPSTFNLYNFAVAPNGVSYTAQTPQALWSAGLRFGG